MKLFRFFVVLILVMCSKVYAYDAQTILGEENFNILLEKGKIQSNKFKSDSDKFNLIPSTLLENQIKNIELAGGSPTLVGENLYLVQKKDLNQDIQKVTIENASVIVRSISKMEGMQYYSNGDKKWETLYHDAYCIESARKRVKVADKTEGSADGIVQYCYLNDNSLGKTNYRVSYFQNDNELVMDFENETGIFMGPIKGVHEKNAHINLEVIDCGEYFVVYMAVKARFPSLGFLEDRLQKSLLNRLEAIYTWFVSEFNSL